MSETKNELIPIESVNAPELFAGKGLDELLAKIEAEARGFAFDMETLAGRKDCASLAYKVARSKTAIDDAGKALVEDWKKQAKVVDDARKKARDRLDALRDEVRKPLDDWEAEQKRLAEEAQAAEENRLAMIVATFRVIADLGDGLFNGAPASYPDLFAALDLIVIDETFGERRADAMIAVNNAREKLRRRQDLERREAELAAKEAELKRKEDEARIKAEAEAAEIQRKAREDAIRKEAAEKAQRDAQDAIDRAEKEKAAAEERARLAAEQAKRDQEAAVKAAEDRAREEAAAKERARLQLEADQKAADEKRASNKRRQNSLKLKAADQIETIISEGLMAKNGQDDIAMAIVEAIAAGEIPAVSIDFT